MGEIIALRAQTLPTALPPSTVDPMTAAGPFKIGYSAGVSLTGLRLVVFHDFQKSPPD